MVSAQNAEMTCEVSSMNDDCCKDKSNQNHHQKIKTTVVETIAILAELVTLLPFFLIQR